MQKTTMPSLRILAYMVLLFGVSAYSSYSANYAMIYHRTAAVTSMAAVAFSLYGIFKMHKALDNNQLQESLALATGGTFLYTLHKPLILCYFLFLLVARIYRPVRLHWNLPLPVSKPEKAGCTLLISSLFLVNDFSREYSVWHKPVWNLMPLAGVGLSLALTIMAWRRVRK